MNDEYKYYEFNPGQSVIYLLKESLGNSNIKAISYFLSPNQSSADMHSHIDGKFKKVNQKTIGLPKREEFHNKEIEIKKMGYCPNLIQNVFNPQQTWTAESNQSSLVLILRFFNLKDKNWDFIYILINSELRKSIKVKFTSLPTLEIKEKEKTELVLSYFKLMYLGYAELINIEYKKYQYFDVMTETLEETIRSKNNLAAEIKDLKKAQKTGLENEIDAILKEKSVEDGPKILLSAAAKEFVLTYQGDEDKLLKAINEAADVVKSMYSTGSAEKLELDPNYIEIKLQKKENKSLGSNKKRKEKARFYLDKYEDAAYRAQKYKNKVTIKYIAEFTQPDPVQPPAVSINIGKYKDEIRYLLLTYKQKWLVLRNHFGPIAALIKDEEIKS